MLLYFHDICELKALLQKNFCYIGNGELGLGRLGVGVNLKSLLHQWLVLHIDDGLDQV